MQNIDQLNTQRSIYEVQIQDLESQISSWEKQLSNPDMTDFDDVRELETKVSCAESKISGIEHKVSVIDRDLGWIERKNNSVTLMAGYKETMQSWSLDKADLVSKRAVLSTRLEQTQTLVETKLTDARLAEETAVKSYAQAVAWSDTKAEEAASAEVRKAAEALTAAQEYQRRQQPIINALKQELKTVDEYIEEADREFVTAEKSAVSLATERLQEEWDAAAERLIEIGAKLYAGKSHMGWEIMAFCNLKIEGEAQRSKTWGRMDVIQMSHEFTLKQVIDVHPHTPDSLDKAA